MTLALQVTWKEIFELIPQSIRSRWMLSLVARNRQAEASVVPPGVTRTFLSVNTFFIFLARSLDQLDQTSRTDKLYQLVNFSDKNAFYLYGNIHVDVSLLGGTVQYVTRTYGSNDDVDVEEDEVVSEFRRVLLYFMFRIQSNLQQALCSHPLFCGSDVGVINPIFMEAQDQDTMNHKKSIVCCTTTFSPRNSLLILRFFNLLIDALNSLIQVMTKSCPSSPCLFLL